MPKIGQGRITTASVIHGWDISQYLGPVSANVVAGTGMFSDIAAGFSDFFGGRSGAYQRQLDAIKSEVLEQLARVAEGRGANWIIGLSLDFDEISGKGKQMLMVSAVGTAVAAVAVASGTNTEDPKGESILPQHLESYLARRELLTQLKAGKLPSNTETRHGVVEHAIVDGLPWLLKHQSRAPPEVDLYGGLTQSGYVEIIDELIRRLESSQPGVAGAVLYRLLDSAEPLLSSPQGSPGASGTRFVVDAITRNSIVAIRVIKDLLRSSEHNTRMWALQTLKGLPPFYTREDILLLREIGALCERSFPRVTTEFEKKGILGKKTYSKCACGSDYDAVENRGYCPKCDRDQFGFPRGLLTPVEAADLVQRHADALEEILVHER